jgi:hypothetical protein
MAFVRIKKVKQWKYAYLVENKWKSKKTKQKVKQYLGRLHTLENIAGAEFGKDIESMSFRDTVSELVKFELMKNGFKEGKAGLKKDGLLVNLEKGEFLDGKKPVVFESNEGFICSFTFNNALNFKKSKNEEETGLRLAETLLEAGISIPHNVFVKLFEKVHKVDVPVIGDTKKFINKA